VLSIISHFNLRKRRFKIQVQPRRTQSSQRREKGKKKEKIREKKEEILNRSFHMVSKDTVTIIETDPAFP
jgi:hypothetical protein